MDFLNSIISFFELLFLAIPLSFSLIPSCINEVTNSKTEQEIFTEKTGLPLPECDILLYENNHSFPSDGETWIIFDFSQDSAQTVSDDLQTADNWQPLPMDEPVAAAFYGLKYHERQFNNKNFSSAPQITEGYWFFYDMQTKNYFMDYETFNQAYSHDFYIAVYDSTNLKTYFYQYNS